MRKIFAVVVSALMLSTPYVKAQEAPVVSSRPGSSVYFELLGNGGFYSVNYDRRFQNKWDGLGGRVGLSYAAEPRDEFGNYNRNFFSVPIGINYLAGKRGHYFETGAGITYYSGNILLLDNVGESENGESDNGVFGNLTFGYRRQPVDGGFTFRAGVSPIITKNSFKAYWPHVSFGYAF